MARRTAASDHCPSPVSASGVMLEEKIVPNGVGTGSPPAKFRPPRTVWQSLQFPIAASSRPRLMRVASNACGAGGSIAAIAGRQTTAKTAAAAASSTTASTLAAILGDPVMAFRPRLYLAGIFNTFLVLHHRSSRGRRSPPVDQTGRLAGKPSVLASPDRVPVRV